MMSRPSIEVDRRAAFHFRARAARFSAQPAQKLIFRDSDSTTIRRVHSVRGGACELESFDLVVIGSGPAGEKGAAQAAYFGKRGALVERRAGLAGAGVNTGTVPSKTLRESALYFSGLKQRGLYGVDYSLREGLTVQDFMHHKDEIVQEERSQVRRNLAAHSVDLFSGVAEFEEAKTLAVRPVSGDSARISGDVFLI